MSYFVQYNSLTISNLPYKWFYFISYLRVARFSSLTNCIFNLVYIRFLNFLFIMIMKAKCGHVTERSYAEAHNGLCRRCHSNFSFILELEQRYGEEALVEYWYSKILTHPTETKEEVDCLINHLVEYYRRVNRIPIEEELYQKDVVHAFFDTRAIQLSYIKMNLFNNA